MHGRYAGSGLPAAIRESYLAGLVDRPKLNDLDDAVAVLEAIAAESAKRIGENDTPRFRERALALFEGLRDALQRGDLHEIMVEAKALGGMLETGAEATRAEEEFFRRTERVQVRREEAWRIRLARGSVMNTQDLIRLEAAKLALIRDWATAQKIGNEAVAALLGQLERLITDGASTATSLPAADLRLLRAGA